MTSIPTIRRAGALAVRRRGGPRGRAGRRRGHAAARRRHARLRGRRRRREPAVVLPARRGDAPRLRRRRASLRRGRLHRARPGVPDPGRLPGPCPAARRARRRRRPRDAARVAATDRRVGPRRGRRRRARSERRRRQPRGARRRRRRGLPHRVRVRRHPVWAAPGDDVLSGGAAGDVLRGGDGDDALEPDTWVDVQGDDVVDGGRRLRPRARLGIDVDAPGLRRRHLRRRRRRRRPPGRERQRHGGRALRRPHPRALCPRRQRRQHRPPELRQLLRRRQTGAATPSRATTAARQLDGGPGDDRLEGGYGHDTLTGGPGRDTIFGDETSQRCSYGDECTVVPYGNDTISARDGEADTVDCGVGDDRAVVDHVDVVANCEIVDRGDSPTPPQPHAARVDRPRPERRVARRAAARAAHPRGGLARRTPHRRRALRPADRGEVGAPGRRLRQRNCPGANRPHAASDC